MQLRRFRNFLLIILLISGNAYAQAQLPKCVLFGFGNCIGTLRFSNGDTYTGEFNYGKPNGKGSFAYANGDSYSGTVAEGQRHGFGTYTSAAGDKYVGQFSEGKFEGVGTYYFLANNRSKGDVYAGEFSSNTFNGLGRYTHANGQVFVGSFVNGRKAVPTVSPETLLAQTEGQRLAEETGKQKAQLEAEKRERLAQEKQAAAAAVVQAKVQRLAEENAKLKAQLGNQLVGDRGARMGQEKQEASAKLASQTSATAATAMISASAVELVQDANFSADYPVASAPAEKGLGQNLVPESLERSKWHLSAGFISSKVTSKATGPCGSGCSSISDDPRAFLGVGYALIDTIGIEAEIATVRSDSARGWINKSNLKNDYAVLMLGGVFSYSFSELDQLNIGGGYRLVIDPSYSSTNSQSFKLSTNDNPYVSVGITRQLGASIAIQLKWLKLSSSIIGIKDGDGYEGFDLGLKYHF
jgi:hypothetical protein